MRWIAAIFVILAGGIVIAIDTGLAAKVFAFVRDVPGGDKVIHFLLVGTLAMMINMALKCKKIDLGFFKVLLGSLIVGVAFSLEEFSQIAMPHRTFDPGDLAANLLGIFFIGRLALRYKEPSFNTTKAKATMFGLFVAIIVMLPALVVLEYQSEIYENLEAVEKHEVAIVFGAGIKNDGSPSDALGDRLISAAELYKAGLVSKILVSGDNRFENYNEPEQMKRYLIEVLEIPSADVVEDFAGRRTYDTCVRANEIWGVERAILVSQGYHLPRALMTCEGVGIDSVGFSASRQGYIHQRFWKLREILAIYRALVDVYLFEPDYIGGEKENFNGRELPVE